MQIEVSKFELDLMIQALDRAASRFESRAAASAALALVREHDTTAANMRRLKHRLLSLRQVIHEDEKKRWDEIAKRRTT